jgi:hypothetical protein
MQIVLFGRILIMGTLVSLAARRASLLQQIPQFGDVHGDAPRLIACSGGSGFIIAATCGAQPMTIKSTPPFRPLPRLSHTPRL